MICVSRRFCGCFLGRRLSRRGFNMMELMLALTLIAIAALTLVALSFTSIASRQKAENLTDAILVADEQLSLAVRTVENLPPSDHDSFWEAADGTEYQAGFVTVGASTGESGATDYNFQIVSSEVPSGTSAPNRLRKLDITVWWWSENAGEARAGSGQLHYSASRLVREVVNDD